MGLGWAGLGTGPARGHHLHLADDVQVVFMFCLLVQPINIFIASVASTINVIFI